MKQKLLVDTDILIDISRGIPTAINRLQKEANTSTLAISSITQMELIVGCHNKTELQNLEKFLRYYLIIKVNKLINDKAIELLIQQVLIPTCIHRRKTIFNALCAFASLREMQNYTLERNLVLGKINYIFTIKIIKHFFEIFN